MSEFNVVRIMDLVESIGENSVKEILSDFSCEYEEGNRNAEVEEFLQKNAIEFSRRKMSITYLVMDDELQVYGYFTLTHKPIVIQDTVLNSRNTRKKLMRHAKFDDELGVYSLSAFLIAQFSKNYNIPPEDRISGVDLMDLTLTYIEDIQEQIGGGVVFLESEDHEGLLNFYERTPNSFVPFSVRYSDTDQTKYIQLMRFL